MCVGCYSISSTPLVLITSWLAQYIRHKNTHNCTAEIQSKSAQIAGDYHARAFAAYGFYFHLYCLYRITTCLYCLDCIAF